MFFRKGLTCLGISGIMVGVDIDDEGDVKDMMSKRQRRKKVIAMVVAVVLAVVMVAGPLLIFFGG